MSEKQGYPSASAKGVSAVVVSIILLIITLSLVGLAYMIGSNYFTAITQRLDVEGGYCVNGLVMLNVRNMGSSPISWIQVDQTAPAGDVANDWNNQVPAGTTVLYTDTCTGKGPRYCDYIFKPGGSGGTKASVYCMQDYSPSDNTICQNAQNGSLCDGLDVLYGEGYKASCCTEHSLCC
jgi:hypothetical protein